MSHSKQTSANEAEDTQGKADSDSTLFDAYLRLMRWVRGLVFKPAPTSQDQARPDAVARRLRLSDRYSALG